MKGYKRFLSIIILIFVVYVLSGNILLRLGFKSGVRKAVRRSERKLSRVVGLPVQVTVGSAKLGYTFLPFFLSPSFSLENVKAWGSQFQFLISRVFGRLGRKGTKFVLVFKGVEGVSLKTEGGDFAVQMRIGSCLFVPAVSEGFRGNFKVIGKKFQISFDSGGKRVYRARSFSICRKGSFLNPPSLLSASFDGVYVCEKPEGTMLGGYLRFSTYIKGRKVHTLGFQGTCGISEISGLGKNFLPVKVHLIFSIENVGDKLFRNFILMVKKIGSKSGVVRKYLDVVSFLGENKKDIESIPVKLTGKVTFSKGGSISALFEDKVKNLLLFASYKKSLYVTIRVENPKGLSQMFSSLGLPIDLTKSLKGFRCENNTCIKRIKVSPRAR